MSSGPAERWKGQQPRAARHGQFGETIHFVDNLNPKMRPRKTMAAACFVAAAALVLVAVRPDRWHARWKTRSLVQTGAPSVVLVTLDTTRADSLEPYGAPPSSTPNLAALALQSVVMENAFAVAPLTLPAHSSVMSGLVPPEHGVEINGYRRLPPDVTTIAEALRDRGYRTGAFVSTAILGARYGLDQGFEVYDDEMTEDVTNQTELSRRRAPETIGRGLRWLHSLDRDAPFFLWIHLYDAHLPYASPPGLEAEFAKDPYRALVKSMDRALEALFADTRVGSPSTMLVVLADHGESRGEHGEMDHGLLAYDATLRIPMLIRLPHASLGGRFTSNVSQIDIAATIAGAAGLPNVRFGEGRDLGALLRSGATRDAKLDDRALFEESVAGFLQFDWSPLHVWRRGDWKAIEGATRELFHTSSDPQELRNVIDGEPARATAMFQELTRFRAAKPETAAEYRPDAEAQRMLESLGYLGGPSVSSRARKPDPRLFIDLAPKVIEASIKSSTNPAESAELCRAVLQRDPGNPFAAAVLLRALVAGGRLDEARSEGTRLGTMHPRNARVQTQIALAEAMSGDRTAALRRLDAAIAADPLATEAHLTRVMLLREAGSLEEAGDALTRARKTLGASPVLDVAEIETYDLPRRRYDAAERKLRGIIDRAPWLIDAWLLLAQVQEDRGNAGGAVATYEAALRRRPEHPELTARLALLVADDEHADSSTERYLREALRVTPRAYDLHVALAGWLSDRGRFGEAIAELDVVLRAFPSHPEAQLNRAVIALREGRLDEAEAMLTKLAPQNPLAEANLAAIAIRRRDWAKAEVHARLAIRFGDREPLAWNNLGIALDQRGRNDEAMTAYQRALRLDEHFWRARLNLAILLVETGRHEQAAIELRRVLSEAPDNRQAQQQLALLSGNPAR